ncbi:MAG: aminodeoxychorismate synthase component I [Clostridiales bacterium]
MRIIDLDIIFDPFYVMNCFKNESYPILLESQMSHNSLGRYSFFTFNPYLRIIAKNNEILIKRKGNTEFIKGNPFDIISEFLLKYNIKNNTNIPFIGGAVGYFGYEMAHFIEDFRKKTVNDLNLPDLVFGFYSHVIVFDHLEKLVKLVILDEIDDNYIDYDTIINKLNNIKKPEFLNINKKVSVKSNMSKSEYLESISKIKRHIKNGDVYQINFTQRFETELIKEPIQIYYELKENNPAPFAVYFDFGEAHIISSSPELFFKIKNNEIIVQPMKGTIGRGNTYSEDLKNLNYLKESKKDQSELVMIVDLERNDLSKICYPNSVNVGNLFDIIAYPTVFQQIANVRGDLHNDLKPSDVLKAIFPGGSITGAPKKRAMEIISDLEPTDRGIYTGAIGFYSFDGSAEFNIAIRTIICHKEKAYYQVGGGIVWDSDPESEYEESILKGKAMREVLINE